MNKEERITFIEKIKEERRKNIREYWETVRTPFKTPDDIPELFQTSKEEWANYYVPILIERGAIPKSELEIGETYLGKCRNNTEATWNGEDFEYLRYKFGVYNIDTCKHFEDDHVYDVFIPIRKI